MGEQQRFGRPPTEVFHLTLRREKDGRISLLIHSRPIGSDQWDRFTLAELDVADAFEASIVELERRML